MTKKLDFDFFLDRISKKLDISKHKLMDEPIHLIEDKLDIEYNYFLSKRLSHPAKFSKLYEPMGSKERKETRLIVDKLLSKI